MRFGTVLATHARGLPYSRCKNNLTLWRQALKGAGGKGPRNGKDNRTMANYETREEWLNAFIDAARPVFEQAGAPLPLNVRVAVGFTSKGMRGRSIGECWSDIASDDGHFEIFIKPTLEGEARICDVLSHELVHAAVGIDAGHGPRFKRVATSIGLVGKMTATIAGPDWMTWAVPLIERLGPIPYAALHGGQSSGRPKQKTYLQKVECPACGFVARVTAKHIEPHSHLNCPVPDCAGELLSFED